MQNERIQQVFSEQLQQNQISAKKPVCRAIAFYLYGAHDTAGKARQSTRYFCNALSNTLLNVADIVASATAIIRRTAALRRPAAEQLGARDA